MATWTPAEVAAYFRRYGGALYPEVARLVYPGDPASNFAPDAECPHTPAQTYTRQPCSCGRMLWPARGRGRGESLHSPRRIAAKLKALDAMALHVQGIPYARIARTLGYRSASGAWMAVQRIRDGEAAWKRFEMDTGYKRRFGLHLTDAEIAEIERQMIYELAAGLDGDRLAAASDGLARLMRRHAGKATKKTR